MAPDGAIQVTQLDGGQRLVEVLETSMTRPSPRARHVTEASHELIEIIAQVKGAGYTCDELARSEDPDYVRADLSRDLFAYLPRTAFTGARICDFGCGSGASTVVLAQLLPETADIDGVDFDGDYLRIAAARFAEFGRHSRPGPRLRALQQPQSTALPIGLGEYDVVICSAVIEHMLPVERAALLPALWRCLRPGGVFFANQTPHRWFPIEAHTTGLPVLNYLPSAAAQRVGRAFGRLEPSEDWATYLRRGIRGATEKEVRQQLTIEEPLGISAAERIPPLPPYRRRIDVWAAGLTPGRKVMLKRLSTAVLGAVEMTTGAVLTPNITVAFRKRSSSS